MSAGQRMTCCLGGGNVTQCRHFQLRLVSWTKFYLFSLSGMILGRSLFVNFGCFSWRKGGVSSMDGTGNRLVSIIFHVSTGNGSNTSTGTSFWPLEEVWWVRCEEPVVGVGGVRSCIESCRYGRGSSSSLVLSNLLCCLASWVLGNATPW
jgi:hypothetical protein